MSFSVAPAMAEPSCAVTVPRRAATESLPVFGVVWATKEEAENKKTSTTINPDSRGRGEQKDEYNNQSRQPWPG